MRQRWRSSERNSTNSLFFERYVLNNAPRKTAPIACPSRVMLWTTLHEKQHQLLVFRALCPEQRSTKNSANCLSFERYVLNNAPRKTAPIACPSVFRTVMTWSAVSAIEWGNRRAPPSHITFRNEKCKSASSVGEKRPLMWRIPKSICPGQTGCLWTNCEEIPKSLFLFLSLLPVSVNKSQQYLTSKKQKQKQGGYGCGGRGGGSRRKTANKTEKKKEKKKSFLFFTSSQHAAAPNTATQQHQRHQQQNIHLIYKTTTIKSNKAKCLPSIDLSNWFYRNDTTLQQNSNTDE